MRQADVFLESEGDAWYARNRHKLEKPADPVCDVIRQAGIFPAAVLEIGCGNGWRLARLKRDYGCAVVGIDPSHDAVREGRRMFPELDAIGLGVADKNPYGPAAFDLVIFGFCLYLADRADLFRITSETDRVLRDGWLVIHDFATPARAFARPYKHRDGLLSYHQDYVGLWTGHPWYALRSREIFGDEQIAVLRKDSASAYPVRA